MFSSKMKLDSCCIFILVLNAITVQCHHGPDTLKLVHILFRHGSITVDSPTMYSNDPLGPNELTLEGKKQMYELGKVFHDRYYHYLGEKYTPDVLEAFASYHSRSKMSLELALASFLPPSQEEIFEPGLNWQPIPFSSNDRKNDDFFAASENCPNFRKELEKYSKSPQSQQELEKYKDMFDYISSKSGVLLRNYYDVLHIINLLAVENELTPEWVTKIDSESLAHFIAKAFSILSANKKITKITAGGVLKKIIDDSLKKIDKTTDVKNRKLFIYSGLDITIVPLLRALKLYDCELPKHGAHVLFELHKINSTYGFKLFYSSGVNTQAALIQIPDCHSFCPIEKFISLTKDYIPDANTCGFDAGCSRGMQHFDSRTVWVAIILTVFFKI